MSKALIHKKAHLKKAKPCLKVNDIHKTLDFYEEALGFDILHEQNNFASVMRDNVIIEFRKSNKSGKGGETEFNQNRDMEIEVDEIEALYNQLSKKKVRMINRISKDRKGYKNFQIQDCNGYMILFSQPNSEE